MSELAVSAEGLERRFGRVVAVAGVDLAIARGEVYGFLGPNGAGKSTVVRMLCTLLLPTAGHARVAGYDVVREAQRVRLRIGAALQEASLDDRQTGLELLRVQARLYGLRGQAVQRRVETVCELIELGDAVRRRIGTYSGGMRRRLDLATALVHEPEVLFLDEPTSGLDPASRIRVWEEIERLNRETGTTIFLTTQYLEEADALAGRVGIIDNGRIVGEGQPGDLKRSVGRDLIVARVAQPAAALAALQRLDLAEAVADHGEEVTVSVADGPAAVTPVALALEREGVQVRELSLRQPTLDDVFLELTGARLKVDERSESEAHGAAEHAPGEAGGAPAPSPAKRRRGARRRPAPGGRFVALIGLGAWLLVVGLAIGIVAWASTSLTSSDSGEAGGPEPTPASAPSGQPSSRPQEGAGPAAPSPPPELVIEGVGTTGSWVQIREGTAAAPVLFEGTFAPDVSQSLPVSGRLWMRIGDTNGVDVTLAGEPQEVAGGTANFIVTPAEVRPE